jgi:hypothetical protein
VAAALRPADARTRRRGLLGKAHGRTWSRLWVSCGADDSRCGALTRRRTRC